MERLWTRSFIFMIVGMFFLFTAFYMLYPTLPLFIKERGGSESQVGLAMGVFMLSSVIFRPFVGGLLDRFGRGPFIISGLLLFAIVMYMYNWIGGIFVLMVLRILHGLTWAVSTTSISTAVTDLIPSNRRGEGMGWSGMAMTLAMAIGPMFGLWVIQKLSYHALFLFAVVLSTAALLFTLGANITFQPKTDVRRIDLFEKSVFPITAAVFLLFIAYGGIISFVPLFADSIKVNSGTFFLVYAATIRLVSPERAGVANASFSTGADLGIGLGAIILGWISQYTSYQVLFTVSAISVAFSLLMFIFFVKNKELRLSTSSLLSKTR